MQKRQPDYNKLVPLVYAPALPLLRIFLNKRVPPGTRDIIFGGAVLTALAHAGYVMSGDSSMGAGN
jgi:acyl-CoA hydrolase